MVKQYVDILNFLGHLTDVTLQWVKAHVGITGNENADSLAKKVATTPCTGPEPFLPVPYREVVKDSYH